jgi:hypothetical protein
MRPMRAGGEHMSEYMFGVGRKRISTANARKINRIARNHGFRFVQADLPDGYRHWFAGPNEGFPFDRDTELAIRADLEAAGLEV